MAEEDRWDRLRAAILPMIMPIAFLFNMGILGWTECDDKVPTEPPCEETIDPVVLSWGLYAMIPGFFCAIYIRFRTRLNTPPPMLFTVYAVLAFVMSISWINLVSGYVVGLLQLFGLVTGFPYAIL
jgi:hypothetical protein